MDFNLNMSLSTMFNVTLDLDPNAFDLKDLSPVDCRQIKVSDLLTPIPKIADSKSVRWHSFWLTIAGLATPAVYARRRYIQQRLAKPVVEIQLWEVARTETELVLDSASSVGSTVFQFRAPATT